MMTFVFAECMVCLVPVGGQRASALSALPLQARTEQDTLRSVQNLFTFINANKSVLLARVVQVDRQPTYQRLRKEHPQADVDRMLAVLGGRLRVLETLSGARGPSEIKVDNKDYLKLQSSVFEGSFQAPDSILFMHPGQFWIVVYDNSAEKLNGRIVLGTVALTGLDDPVLALYRRRVAWLALPDDRQALAETRAVLLDPKEIQLSRLAALYPMDALVRRKNPDFGKGPDYPFMRHTLAELLAQRALPRELLMTAIQSIYVDPRREIVAGSEEAALLHYLLSEVEKGTDDDIVSEAADKLQYITSQSDDHPPYTAYYFPQIVEAIVKRHQRDEATRTGRRFPAGRAYVNLLLARRLRLEDIKGVPVVLRGIPDKQQE